MAGNIVASTELGAQFQTPIIEYGEETKLKLKQNNGLGFNRGSNRGRLEIMAEILCHCGQQKTKTNIMYNVNLNYAQLKKYLKSLTSKGLLTANRNKYATTWKGQRFLELFVQLNNILEF